ncbi:MAG: o-succinylbenzoate synthase [Prevotella sp.]|nr:o-succinylbenzoate synthase [Prevotella sp.]
MKIDIQERVFHFKQPAGTSRGVYTERLSWMVTVTDGDRIGVGECAPLPDLSCDALPPSIYKKVLRRFCDDVERTGIIDTEALRPYPSMLFGLETALLDTPFDTPFARGEEGITINGLVWMGTYDEMLHRMEEKLAHGFRCIKLKIGAIDFERELDLIRQLRRRFSHHEVELRVDANGAFDFANGDALYKLELLSQYALHSIEQPIRQGQWANMAELCRESPLPIALDEELIGVNNPEQKRQMLNIIRPAYIVLKPSLHGGMVGCREWVSIAQDMGIGWWITSALESNIGLNAIAQFCSAMCQDTGNEMPQGLGTGQLFTDNIPMSLDVVGDQLFFRA